MTKQGFLEDPDGKPFDENFLPKHMPFFHAIQVDGNNNILVFLYTSGKPTTTASIYSAFTNKGQAITTSTFKHDGFKLNFKPASQNLQFGNKQIHAIVREGVDKKSPFKLVKFNF